jgi:glycosyltransferase involved in cell wall biosynthesis
MPSAKRILMVEGSGRGFLSHYAHALALGLHDAGDRVVLMTAPWDELASWPAPFERHTTLCSGLGGWRRLMAETRRFAPDVVHFQWLSDPVSAALYVGWAQRRGAVVMYTPHNLLPHRGRWMTMPLFRRLYGAFDRIVVRDSAMRWAAHEMLDVDPDRMSMAMGSPNIIAHPNAPRRLPKDAPLWREGEVRALHFGHGSPRKGLEPLLAALSDARGYSNLHLLLAGCGVTAGIDARVITAARRRLRISIIDRYLEPDEVGGLFEQADLVTMPYAKLCRSPILDLAAAFRRPVLRTRRVEATHFQEGLHGLTVEHCESTAFADQLLALAASPATLDTMRTALEREPDFALAMAALAARHGDIYHRTITGERGAARRKGAAVLPMIAGE